MTNFRKMRLIEHCHSFASWLLKRPRAWSFAVYALQASVIVFSGISAFLLRFEFTLPAVARPCFVWGLLVWITINPLILRWSRVVGGWRHFSTSDFGRLLPANAACLAASALVLAFACPCPSGARSCSSKP
jgi:hypothetical protein